MYMDRSKRRKPIINTNPGYVKAGNGIEVDIDRRVGAKYLHVELYFELETFAPRAEF